MYRAPHAAPLSSVPDADRGRVVGKMCLACGAIYSRHAAYHRGKPSYGKDHVAAPCSHEAEAFAVGADWWEPAVEVVRSGER